jgi:drug/metabolite transporter (DMT)-like permease
MTRPATSPTSDATSPASPASGHPAPSNEPRDWLVFGLLGLFWGTSYLFIKIGVDEALPTFVLISGRLAVGGLLLAGVLVLRRIPLPRDPALYGRLFVSSMLSIALPFTLITWGEQSIDSALAAVLNSSVPLFTIVLAALFLHDEPITVNRLVGLLVGFGGVVIVTGGGMGATAGSGVPGELAMIAASLSYGAGNVYTRRAVRGVNSFVTSFVLVTFAFLVTFALSLVMDPPWTVSYTPRGLFAMAWLGIFGSGLAYLCFYHLHARWGATRSSLVAYLLPIVGVAAGFLVLGETIDLRIVVGTALIIGGVGLVNSRYGSRRLYGRGAG